ncbi:MAG: menaquinone biosynthesis protein [Acidobacteriota bacterium]|nr:menaquinone biosynthesis protein [Acidobacteriota bacterium]
MLRVAAINFLNPAPLMWDFEHPPHSKTLARRYSLHYTQPSQCAADLLTGRADLGLIPVASLTPELAIVPGCTIASLDQVRSIQLILKAPFTLETVRTVAADTASRSSLAYAEILLRKFAGNRPVFHPADADPIVMLASSDACLLIGDPALLALKARSRIETVVGPCTWMDLAQLWRRYTGLPWVAAVWAVRPEALQQSAHAGSALTADLQDSRDHGLSHIEDLVQQWTPRIGLPPETIRRYLTQNIFYSLDEDCIRAVQLFRKYAAELDVLPPLPHLRFL